MPGDEGTGRYRGRRRGITWIKRRGAQVGLAAVVAAVGVVLVGSSVLARTLSDSAAAPAPSPSETASPSPSPTPVPVPVPTGPSPTNVARFGTAPEPEPTPSPERRPEPAPESTQVDPPPEEPSDEPTPVELSFEAEDADLGGDADVVPRQDASGGASVILPDSGSFVRFEDITVDEAGEYELALHYSSRCCDTIAFISVNNGRPAAVEFPEPPGNRIDTATGVVELAAGANTIAVFVGGDPPGPTLDRITVTG